MRITSGPAIERAGDLAAVLTSLGEGDVLFIDEIHRIARPAEELLYVAMEDFRVDVVVGKGPGATAIPLDVAPFTLVGATTRAGLLTGPLRDRFGFVGHMDFYEPAELERCWPARPGCSACGWSRTAADEIAGRSRGTPRIANRLLRRVRDFAEVRADGVVTRAMAQAALRVYDVDELGLDRLDRAVLDALVRRFGGGPVGVSTLAVAVGEEPRDGGGGGRAVPGAGRPARPYAARPGRHPGGLAPPGTAAPPADRRRGRRCSTGRAERNRSAARHVARVGYRRCVDCAGCRRTPVLSPDGCRAGRRVREETGRPWKRCCPCCCSRSPSSC